MKHLVCVAGCEQSVVDHLRSLPSKRLTEGDAADLFTVPLRAPMAYRPGMSAKYLKDMAARVSELPTLEDVSILLAYVDYGDQASRDFVQDFFPFAITAPIEPFYYLAAEKFERRSRLLKQGGHIVSVVEDLRARAAIVRDVHSGRVPNPLLLPLQNFQSGVVRGEIERLFDTIGASPTPRQDLLGAAGRILATHPVQQIQGSGRAGKGAKKTSYVRDDRLLRFKSPGDDRHGMARAHEGAHEAACLLASRARLGGSYDPLIHYDCDLARGRLSAAYPNCHGHPTAPAKASHVNIAPNDAVR